MIFFWQRAINLLRKFIQYQKELNDIKVFFAQLNHHVLVLVECLSLVQQHTWLGDDTSTIFEVSNVLSTLQEIKIDLCFWYLLCRIIPSQKKQYVFNE